MYYEKEEKMDAKIAYPTKDYIHAVCKLSAMSAASEDYVQKFPLSQK